MAFRNALEEARELARRLQAQASGYLARRVPFSQAQRQAFQPMVQKAKPVLQKVAKPVTRAVIPPYRFYEQGPQIGRQLQKTTIPGSNLAQKYSKLTPGIPALQLPSMLQEQARSYGRTLERSTTPAGRGQILSSAKKIIKKPFQLSTLQEPAFEAALDLPDILPGGFLMAGLTKKVAREVAEKGIKELGEKGARELAEKKIKGVAKGSLDDLVWARGTRAAGIQKAGLQNYNKATKLLESAGELSKEIKTTKTTKDFIKNYYETKKPPVIGDSFVNAKGEKVEIIKIGDNSVDYFLKGKKKGIHGTVYLKPKPQGSIGDAKTFQEWLSGREVFSGRNAEDGYAYYLEQKLGRTPTVKELKNIGKIDTLTGDKWGKDIPDVYGGSQPPAKIKGGAGDVKITAKDIKNATDEELLRAIKRLPESAKELPAIEKEFARRNIKLTSRISAKPAEATSPTLKGVAPSPQVGKLKAGMAGEGGGVSLKAQQETPLLKASKTQLPTILRAEAPTTRAKLVSGSSKDIISQQQKLLPEKGTGYVEPVQKIINALGEAKPLRGQQEALYSKARAQRVARVSAMGRKVPGEQGYFAQLGQLKGELPKVEFESIRKQIGQQDIDSLFNTVEKANITPFEKVTAKGALAKILGAEGGRVPTRNEISLLSEIFPKDFVDAVLKNRSTMQKLFAGVGEVLNLPRAIMASADLSAPLRQGVFLVGRPKQWIPAFKDMFKYAFSEKAYLKLADDIKARPNYLKMRESKLALTDLGTQMTKREEAFMSGLAEKIPGFGKIARASNRAYSGFLNKLRADVFDDLYNTAAKSGALKGNPKLAKDLASFVNAATGRGNLGATLQKAAPILNGAFFSPRLIASRVNLLNPVYYAKLNPFVRKEALKSLLTFGTIAMTIMGLAKLGGAEVGADPRNADFGKIKVGNTRYDILGGFQQYIRLAAQLISGKIVSSTTGRTITLGEGYKPLTRKDILQRFFEYKTSPVASFAIALMTGKTAIGDEFNVSTELINRLTPMVMQDIYDLSQEKNSIGEALIRGLPAIFGTGVQTYGKQEAVFGKSKIGTRTAQIRPVQGFAEKATTKLFGEKPLGTSATYNVQSFVDQLDEMPPAEATRIYNQIKATNEDLAKKIWTIKKENAMGITVEDKDLKSKGVSNGERTLAIKKQLDKLKTPKEKAALWDDYVKKKIITKEVAKQLKQLLQ